MSRIKLDAVAEPNRLHVEPLDVPLGHAVTIGTQHDDDCPANTRTGSCECPRPRRFLVWGPTEKVRRFTRGGGLVCDTGEAP